MSLKVAYINNGSIDARSTIRKVKVMTEQERFNQEMNNKFFKKACDKYADEINEVKEYFPDWEPKF
jgi:hypothetical protein